jgi:hypothetical protein
MGKIQDTLEWIGELKEKTKDIYGTGIEAFKTSGEKAKEMMDIASPN